MAYNGLLSQDLATEVGKTWGVTQKGVRAGSWLLREQASDLFNAPDPPPSRANATAPCWRFGRLWPAPRRVAATSGSIIIQQREGRWVIPDLGGKGNRIRTVPVPAPVKAHVDKWLRPPP